MKDNRIDFEKLNFPKEWLETAIDSTRDSREIELECMEHDLVAEVYEQGGLEGVDQLLNMRWNAWLVAGDMIRIVDHLFFSENRDEFVEKVVKQFVHSMTLNLECTETYVQWKHDPEDKAEGLLQGFGYSVADDLKNLL